MLADLSNKYFQFATDIKRTFLFFMPVKLLGKLDSSDTVKQMLLSHMNLLHSDPRDRKR